MAVDLNRKANGSMWNIYSTARLYMDMDYIANYLIEIIEPDDVMTEEVMDRLRNDPAYLEAVAEAYSDSILLRITNNIEIDALHSAVKYRKFIDEIFNREEK